MVGAMGKAQQLTVYYNLHLSGPWSAMPFSPHHGHDENRGRSRRTRVIYSYIAKVLTSARIRA